MNHCDQMNHVDSIPFIDFDAADEESEELSMLKKLTMGLPKASKLAMKAFEDFSPDTPEEEPSFTHMFTKNPIDGLSEWYEARSWKLKVAWTVIVVGAVISLTYCLYETLAEFIDDPVITNYRLVHQHDGMPFPEVFICPSIAIHRTQRQLSKIDGVWEKEFTDQLISGADDTPRLKPNISRLNSVPLVEAEELWIPNKVEEYYDRVGYPLTFFLKCSFNGVEENNCSDYVTPFFDPNCGKCFLYKTNKLQHDGEVGLGLRLWLDLDHENAQSRFKRFQVIQDRVKLKIGEKIGPTQTISTEEIFVSPGTYSSIKMEVTRIEDSRFVDCSLEQKKYSVIRQEYFSREACVLDCKIEHYWRACQCYQPIDSKYLNSQLDHTDFCINATQVECFNNKTMDPIDACTKECRSPCAHWEYKLYATSANLVQRTAHNNGDGVKPLYDNFLHEHVCNSPPPFLLSDPQTCKSSTSVASLLLATGTKVVEWLMSGGLSEIPRGTRWYWNMTAEDCQSMESTKCHEFLATVGNKSEERYANRNWFRTKTECLNICGYGNLCLAPPLFPVLEEEQPTERYAYDLTLRRCVRQHYFGKHAIRNENHFKTRDECDQRCNETAADPCNIDTKAECLKRPYYFFNSTSNECQLWDETLFANCTMLIERFSSLQECLNASSDTQNNTDFSLFEWESETLFEQNCNDTMFYHNPRTGNCEKFPHLGCSFPVENSFGTIAECESMCRREPMKPPGWHSSVPLRRNITEKQRQDQEKYEADVAWWDRKNRKGDLVLIEISFKSSQYISLTEKSAMTYMTFVSNVGGQVGLWVGCSVVTMVKMFFVVVPICWALLKKKRKQRRVELYMEDHNSMRSERSMARLKWNQLLHVASEENRRFMERMLS